MMRVFLLVTMCLSTSVAHAAPGSDNSEIITIKAGGIGPYYCSAGQIRSAQIISGGKKEDLLLGMRRSSQLMTLGVGGPSCADLGATEPKKAANCLKLSAPSQTDVKIRVACDAKSEK